MDVLYTIQGVVIKGDGRGKTLGFPTANIKLHKEIPEGIYAAKVFIGKKGYNAASFVGAAKTFEKSDVNLESYLFDFSGDLYGKNITVMLYKSIRDNKKFETIKALVAQMHKDVEEIRKFFTTFY